MTIGIVGLGLIGGSVGLGLRPHYEIVGYDPDPEVRRRAVSKGSVTRAVATLELLSRSSVVVVATPPEAVVDSVALLAPLLEPSAVFTDCSSVKGEIVSRLREVAPAAHRRFVGGHPMAGGHLGGIEHADGSLFRGAPWILTPADDTDPDAVEIARSVPIELGAREVYMSVEEHDHHVAVLSHLPHAVAAALVEVASDLAHPSIAAGSWADLTRVAGSDPELWGQILFQNRREVVQALDVFGEALLRLRASIERGDDLRPMFESVRRKKMEWKQQ
jgi:prephenate dehydrogenase